MNAAENQFEWKVLLLGGSSGVGKTLIAQDLARRLSVSLLLADDVRLAIQQTTTPTQLPDLHIFLSYGREQWRLPDAIRDDWITLSQAMAQPLKAIMAHHLSVPSAGPIIIEGDCILPSLAKPSNWVDMKHFQDKEAERQIRAVFLFEPDENILLKNLHARGRGFKNWEVELQRAFAHASWLYGQWLVEKAQADGVPVLQARPYETIIERIVGAME